jgi:hypothetical protein
MTQPLRIPTSIMTYHIIKDGQSQGPYSKDELIMQGIDAYTNVWCEGMTAWTPAGQVPELADMFSWSTPPPIHSAGGHKHSFTETPLPELQQEDTSAAKPRNMKLLLLGGIIVAISIGVALFIKQMQPSSPAVQEDVRVKDSVLRKESEGELREQLKAKENQHPTEFLAGEISFHDNLIGQSVIRGHVTNSATAATFKDIELTITYLSKTGAIISNEIFTVYEVVRPGQSASFKFKTRSPKGTKDAEMVVSGAKVE